MNQDDIEDRTLPRENSGPGKLERPEGGPPVSGELPLPQRLGRYRLLHLLGQGGMGMVYAAEDESLGRRIAVKTITAVDDSSRERFRREARAAAGVNHPNICQVYEIGEDSARCSSRWSSSKGNHSRNA